MNTIPHPNQFRFWPKWKHWGMDEREAKTKFQTGQRNWAYKTRSSFEGMENYFLKHPEHRNGWPSIHKRKQYEAAMRILVTEKLNR